MSSIGAVISLQATQNRKRYGLKKVLRDKIANVSSEKAKKVAEYFHDRVHRFVSEKWKYSRRAEDMSRDPERLIIRVARTPSELEEVVHEFKERDIKSLFISGGDGTNRRVIKETVNRYCGTSESGLYLPEDFPNFVPGNGGRENFLAKYVGITKSPEENLAQLVRLHAVDMVRTEPVKTLKINTPETNYGFVFANGVLTNFFDLYNSDSLPGRLTVAKIIFKTIASLIVGGDYSKNLLAKTPYEVWLDGEHIPHDLYSYISVSSLNIDIIGGAHPFKKADDGYHFFGGEVQNSWQLARNFYRLWTEKDMELDGIIDRFMNHSVIICSDQPQKMLLDGDVVEGGTETSISQGPKLDIVTNLGNAC